MHEWDSVKKTEQISDDIEERLRAYYGPALPEQPLARSSWLHLRAQLMQHPQMERGKDEDFMSSPLSPKGNTGIIRPQRSRHMIPGRFFARKRHFTTWRSRVQRPARQHSLPLALHESCRRIASLAHLSLPAELIRYQSSARLHMPDVRVALSGRHAITLLLPARDSLASLSQPELDVLLASGLARYRSIRQPGYLLTRSLIMLLLPVLLSTTVIVALWRREIPWALPALLCLLLSAAIFVFLSRQDRTMARQADLLMVQWIGREQACRGLHALAARSRNPARRRWNDLSLTERIERVCGASVPVEEEHFTLVR